MVLGGQYTCVSAPGLGCRGKVRAGVARGVSVLAVLGGAVRREGCGLSAAEDLRRGIASGDRHTCPNFKLCSNFRLER